MDKISITSEVSELLKSHMPVAIGVSGGKDSTVAAWATDQYLNSIGHKGPRVLIHADLGRVEWKQSIEICRSLAKHLGYELIVVQRAAGDMLDRWQTRWENNVERYRNLQCVKLILPWSTPAMRFCTSELKTAIICRELIKRFPGKRIVSISGIRKQESSQRAKSPIYAVQNKLTSVTHQTSGIDWHPILDWSINDVWNKHVSESLPIHQAYTLYGMSRVSCAFCIMSSQEDLVNSATCPDNQEVYRQMVDLEIQSTFAFQSSRWLGDVAPNLLKARQKKELLDAKAAAAYREQLEGIIPGHLLYEKGWPNRIPSYDEAELLTEVRLRVSRSLRIEGMKYLDPGSIINRYIELMATKELKQKGVAPI